MTQLPRISVVIPNLNCAEFLERTIRSVIDQNYPNLELILSDGGSTDGSLEIVEKYRNFFSAVLSEPDDGQAHAINRGFAVSTGEVMGWINSDDVLMPGGLSLVGSIFALNPSVEWLTGRVTCIDEVDQVLSVRRPRPVTHTRFLAADYQWIQQESTFWRRSLWDVAGGGLNQSLRLAVDGELWLRFSRHATMLSVHNQIGAFRFRSGQRSEDIEAYHAEMLEVIDAERATVVPQDDLVRRILDEPLKLRTRKEANATFPDLRKRDPAPFARPQLWKHRLLRRLHRI
ncbi:Glycosyl transferase family 2 [Ruegeria intermedia]|uniref:Glycosyl transferase family 2 n=1 Tax=Ruegeria intermedia TaxID=996115 RepID=A0A1M4YR98_9RHOB|nr:glycosyltransferase family 2 protein [Ruegeria intermedia]SHF08213.1 Glycosyl transferase family 2 [Ruegeria intermedia]